jgi:hypothetical protein
MALNYILDGIIRQVGNVILIIGGHRKGKAFLVPLIECDDFQI